MEPLHDFNAFEALLNTPGRWLGAFDFPFGLPRAFVDALGLGCDIVAVTAELHRRCDTAEPGVSSASPLQTRCVPVGFMFFEGVSRLPHAGVTLPQMHAGDPARAEIVRTLEAGHTRLTLQLCVTPAQRKRLLADPAGDWLDAVLCLVQAAWASRRADFGLPLAVDPVEGWIVSAGWQSPSL